MPPPHEQPDLREKPDCSGEATRASVLVGVSLSENGHPSVAEEEKDHGLDWRRPEARDLSTTTPQLCLCRVRLNPGHSESPYLGECGMQAEPLHSHASPRG